MQVRRSDGDVTGDPADARVFEGRGSVIKSRSRERASVCAERVEPICRDMRVLRGCVVNVKGPCMNVVDEMGFLVGGSTSSCCGSFSPVTHLAKTEISRKIPIFYGQEN